MRFARGISRENLHINLTQNSMEKRVNRVVGFLKIGGKSVQGGLRDS